MKQSVGGFIVGVVTTLLIVIVGAFAFVPGMMIVERESPLGLDDTVARITAAVQARGWNLSSVAELEKSVKKHGGPDVPPVRLINICQAQHAGKILLDDTAKRASVLMPCTIAVYQKSNGKVFIGSMNAGIMGKLFGGVIAEVMSGPVAADQEAFVASVQ